MSDPELSSTTARFRAQLAYNRGDFTQAIDNYGLAEGLALDEEPPNYYVASMAVRGVTESFRQLGDNENAENYASISDHHFGQAVDQVERGEVPANRAYEINRERIQRATTNGKLLLKGAIEQEAEGVIAAEQGAQAYDKLQEGQSLLREVQKGRSLDQYAINAASRWALSCAFYGGQDHMGDKKQGISESLRSIYFAARSESPRLPTNAGYGFTDRVRAKGRAFIRGSAALGASLVVSPHPNKRREFAARIAQRAV